MEKREELKNVFQTQWIQSPVDNYAIMKKSEETMKGKDKNQQLTSIYIKILKKE